MLEYKHEVTSVEGMAGHVIVRVPSMKERLVLLKEAGVNGKEDAGLDVLIGMMDKVSLFVKEVDLKMGDYEFKDLDAIGHYAFGMTVYNEVAAIIMNGIPAGKK